MSKLPSSNTLCQKTAVQLCRLLYERNLQPGTKLLGEANLARTLRVSPDTLRAARALLEKIGVIRIVPNSGTYVTEQLRALFEGGAEHEMDRLLSALFSDCQLPVVDAYRLCLRQLAHSQPVPKLPRVAWIDGCTEMLETIANQLHRLCPMLVDTYELSVIESSPEILPGAYDFILTTPSHADQLSALLGRQCQITRLAVSLAPSSAMDFAEITGDKFLRIVYRNDRFYRYVRKTLESFAIKNTLLSCFMDSFPPALDPAQNVLIVPYGYAKLVSATVRIAIEQFKSNGGQLIMVDFVIDNGSQFYFQETLQSWHNAGASRTGAEQKGEPI